VPPKEEEFVVTKDIIAVVFEEDIAALESELVTRYVPHNDDLVDKHFKETTHPKRHQSEALHISKEDKQKAYLEIGDS